MAANELLSVHRSCLRRGGRRWRLRACARRWVARKRARRPRASPRCSRRARIPSRRKAASSASLGTYGRGRLALAHVRHRQRAGLAGRSGRYRIPGARGAWPRSTSSNTGACPLFAHRRGPRCYQRAFGGMTAQLRRSADPAHLRGGRPHRPRHSAHPVRSVGAPRGRLLRRVFRARPDHGRRRLPRRHRLEARRRDSASLPRQAGDPGHRRLWPGLFQLHQRPHMHRRRRRRGAACGPAAAGHGVRCSSTPPASMARAC